MRFTFADPPAPETSAERRVPGPTDRDSGACERTCLALPLSTSEAQAVVLVESLAWIGVAVWCGGLAWLLASDIATRRSRHHAPDRDDRDGGLRLPEDLS